MNNPVSLMAIRKRHFMLEALPDTIVIPALGREQSEQIVKPISEATLDDVAFALRGLDAEFSAVSDRLHALKKLYQMARDAGAIGADYALDVVASSKGKR
ncbi:MAG: hypothetical protein HYX36_00400 [Rhizobiales bacterium]|nr:hypothetical protein [Hyphomicrobiales bacterium]